MADEELYYVYTLRYPIGHKQALTPFYVGIAADLIKRAIQHLQPDGSNEGKDKVIHSIKNDGHLPIIHTEATCHGNKRFAERVEAYCIEYYRTWGCPLTNKSLMLSDDTRRGRLVAEQEHFLLYDFKRFFRWNYRFVYWLTPYIMPWERKFCQWYKASYRVYCFIQKRPFIFPHIIFMDGITVDSKTEVK